MAEGNVVAHTENDGAEMDIVHPEFPFVRIKRGDLRPKDSKWANENPWFNEYDWTLVIYDEEQPTKYSAVGYASAAILHVLFCEANEHLVRKAIAEASAEGRIEQALLLAEQHGYAKGMRMASRRVQEHLSAALSEANEHVGDIYNQRWFPSASTSDDVGFDMSEVLSDLNSLINGSKA